MNIIQLLSRGPWFIHSASVPPLVLMTPCVNKLYYLFHSVPTIYRRGGSDSCRISGHTHTHTHLIRIYIYIHTYTHIILYYTLLYPVAIGEIHMFVASNSRTKTMFIAYVQTFIRYFYNTLVLTQSDFFPTWAGKCPK